MGIRGGEWEQLSELIQQEQMEENKHTGKSIRSFASVKAEIFLVFRLSEFQYNRLLFEHGYEFAKKYNAKVLTNKKFGFWAWWQYVWVMNDVAILESGYANAGLLYCEIKQALIEESAIISLFKVQFKNIE